MILDNVELHNIAEARPVAGRVGLCPPTPDEPPRPRYPAYGTSITHGAADTGPHLADASQAARRLGAHLIHPAAAMAKNRVFCSSSKAARSTNRRADV